MRISYRNKTEIDSYDNEFKGFQVFTQDQEGLKANFLNLKKLFFDFKEMGLQKKIISNVILDKVSDINISKKVVKEFISEKNKLEKGIIISNKMTIFYHITDDDLKLMRFENGCLVSGFDTQNNLTYNSNFYSEKYNLDSVYNVEDESLMDLEMMMLFGILAFIKYADIETKILEPKKKEKLFGCKYLNETNSDIQIIDSTWFTNLIKSDGFKVRGHFRLQPKKKDGEWTKELIWINDFEKSGYTAPARMLAQV